MTHGKHEHELIAWQRCCFSNKFAETVWQGLIQSKPRTEPRDQTFSPGYIPVLSDLSCMLAKLTPLNTTQSGWQIKQPATDTREQVTYHPALVPQTVAPPNLYAVCAWSRLRRLRCRPVVCRPPGGSSVLPPGRDVSGWPGGPSRRARTSPEPDTPRRSAGRSQSTCGRRLRTSCVEESTEEHTTLDSHCSKLDS